MEVLVWTLMCRYSMAISLLDAIRNGDVATAKKLLQQKKYLTVDYQNIRRDGSALFWACCRGYMEIVQLLLMNGADVNAVNSWNSTPICAATDNHHTDIVRYVVLYRQPDIQITRYTYRQTDKLTDRQTDNHHTDIVRYVVLYRQTYIQIDSQIYIQTNKHTDRRSSSYYK